FYYLKRFSYVRQFVDKIIHVMVDGCWHVTLLLIDIVYFKNINDTYGHDAGVAFLKQLDIFLKRNSSDGSEAFRNGG
ncbi:hypothetical protein DK295_16095, partial [Listeria monocytogenes]|uniref:diguanylate cyclase n=1 Tax=Listeria monocytogenes TaxID=1639 RepID=UPI000D9147DA